MRTRTLMEKLKRIEKDAETAARSSMAANHLLAGAAGGGLAVWLTGGSLVAGVGAGLVVGVSFATFSNCFFDCREKTPDFDEVDEADYVALQQHVP